MIIAPQDAHSVTLERKAILGYDDGTIRPHGRLDDDEREALAETHEPRTVGDREAWVRREGDGDE